MALNLRDRAKKAWNAFTSRDPTEEVWLKDYGMSYTYKPDRVQLNIVTERTFLASIINRIGVDVAALSFQHVRTDQNGIYLETIPSELNDCLTIEANKDQSGTDFIRDAAMSIMDEGCVALVPIEADLDPDTNGSFKIYSIRTGEILEWKPDMIRVRVYDDRAGIKKEIWVSKKTTAIIENPFYAVMNEPNSTLQRLNHKLNLLDRVDTQNSSGKLDLIIQLPYSVKSGKRQEMAEKRRKDLEVQLTSSAYGIGYIDSTERITQLNRAVENTLLTEIKDLKQEAMNQLNMTENILNGTASEEEQLSYYTRTVGVIAKAITDGLIRTFLTKTARTQGQTIRAFRNPFDYVPLTSLSNILVDMKREEIITGNEARSYLGVKPSNDPRANELRNANVSARDDQLPTQTEPTNQKEGENQNEV